ncbi:hypothetical protein ABT039_38385 [Streptomyces lasiicapitis]|uniref:Uncharacterized protein n=2 Tax=Streptomyces lasiicapitis TaxID=1923961 RepID=A0ABQ2MCY9_9ACTN|nr:MULTISPECIES: hypothetical protein [Streptomyces]QIB46589.1 hypothetical protein G3H79_29410 [Streptomyces aureoverticillatus]GGO49660.1 hypothetical protein GCM10012286_48120 [Streptomyces lasiicapitis]
MSARAHTRRDPADQAKPAGIEIQLPWWAIALPAIAFAALLLLILNPADAHAASSEPAVSDLLERVRDLLRIAA